MIMRRALLLGLAQAQLHFASLGNWGAGNAQQHAVARSLKAAAANPPLSFVVSPGSNFMEGVANLEDARWYKEFRDVYSGPELNCPWFVALGGHDWDGNVTAMVLRTNATYGHFTRVREIEEEDPLRYTEDRGPRWTLPNFFYHYTQTFTDTSSASALMSAPEVSVFFAFIDTRILGQGFPVPGATERHWEELKQTLEAASKSYDWLFVVGDEAIYSSGRSGGSKYLRKHLRELLRSNLVDAYIAGRDRDMEVIEDGSLSHIMCGSGSGGRAGKFFAHDGSIYWTKRPGFCYHTLTKNKFTTQFIDGLNGKTLHAFTKKRNIKNDAKTDKLKHLTQIPRVKYIPMPAGIGGAPGGGVYRTPNSIFVIVCGTIGLLIASMILTAATAVSNTRVSRWTGGVPYPYNDLTGGQSSVKSTTTTTTTKQTTVANV
ncbi:putative acid phosphatase [Gregarina niphandrodes]|uniref:Acid phosphatase n=1 Tax=Gregarina niphandrodes TaxID=110365 RepID=A0A023B3A7_GRENI|nr:putative acid phosphatase [Gregarina niphandrodes]EZG55430.1 putative acid phosphatase [Gregarina niphandrodes]|eukprot:XP_011131570.1 putative acid phosphatase [Gregarina niphandrodes]